MTCPVCPLHLTPEVYPLLSQACGPCHRHIRQMQAGFRGLVSEKRQRRFVWNNTEAYEAWKAGLTEADLKRVTIGKRDPYVEQRCDVRDMKRVVGLPKFPVLEEQVFTAWILEGTKDERMQEVLGLTYSQLFQIKTVIRIRLQKQMAYYIQVKRLAEENANG